MDVIDRLYARYVPPTDDYCDILDKIHQHLLPRTYVEIGVARGRTLTLALPGTRCVGIDPEPAVEYHLPRSTQLFAETSDDFFAGHDLVQVLGGLPVDLAFIDGFHHFEFALRDFVNLERACHEHSTILVHDCLPRDAVTASRERTTDFWSGDVWRLIVLLAEYRPDLEVSVVDCAPTGLGVVRGLDPASDVLDEHMDEIVARYLDVPYEALETDAVRERFARATGDWETVRRLLPDRPFRGGSVEVLKAGRTVGAAVHAHRRGRELRASA